MRILRRLQGEEGIALVLALGLMIGLTAAGATVLIFTSSNTRSSNHSKADTGAYALAEAGIAEALSKLANASNPTQSDLLPETVTTYDNGGTATYSGALSGTLWTLTSIGRMPNPTGPESGQVARTLSRTVEIRGLDVGSLSNDWNRIHQESTTTCFNVPVNIPARVTAKGNLCLLAGGTITGGSTTVSVGGNVTLSGGTGSYVKNPGTGAGWTNPGNIGASDNAKATTTLAANSTSGTLDASNFSMGIPADAVINGITARIERASSVASTTQDYQVYLLKNGSPAGSNKAATGTYWGTADAYRTYGSSSDLWGTTWTPADLNASNFGLRVVAKNLTMESTSSVASPGAGAGWTSPGNIGASDNAKATTSLGPGATSGTLDASSMGFALPSDAVITGISARIERAASVSSTIQDTQVYLLKNGSPVGSNKAATGTYWGTGDAYRTYGAAGDLWGTTWTRADINASNFGLRLVGKNFHGTSTSTGSVDHMEVTVYYDTWATPTASVDHMEITVSWSGNYGSIGTSGTPVASADVVGTCKLGTNAAHTPCSSADNVFANTITTQNTVAPKPTVDFNYWWAQAKPGPKYPCNETSGSPPTFDNNAGTTSAPDGSAATFELTPDGADYVCRYKDAEGNVLGELSWNRSNRELTIKGTVYFDGNAEFHDHVTTPVHYHGRGTIWISKNWHNDEAVCAGGTGMENCRDGDMTAWDPEDNLLSIIAGGTNTAGNDDFHFHQNYSAFQGILYAKNDCKIGDAPKISGPLFCDRINLEDSTIEFYPWPALPGLTEGQLYTGGTKLDKQLLLGKQTG